MINNLVAFGCSWTQGSELDDPATEAYPALIAKHFNWTVKNLGTPKTTLYDMLLDLKNWLANHSKQEIAETLIIIGLTDESRGLRGSDLITDETVYDEAVTAFDDIAKEYNASLLQFNVLTKNYKIKLPTLIESSSALEMLVIRDKPRRDPLFKEFKHPNEKGQKIISEFLIKQVDSVIINE